MTTSTGLTAAKRGSVPAALACLLGFAGQIWPRQYHNLIQRRAP